MKEKFEKIYQFKITLKWIEPPIWRRIQVPETYTFWDLHVAIQNVMGWWGIHLHAFQMKHPKLNKEVWIEVITPEELMEMEYHKKIIFDERKEKIKDWFIKGNKVAEYLYDFGDNWSHNVELEEILPRDKGKKYPVCIAGERACPPEDCGGVHGYYKLLEILRNPNHAEYESTREWLEMDLGITDYDPEAFDPKEVEFEDPEEVWREVEDELV